MKYKKIKLDYGNLPKTIMVNLENNFREKLFSDSKLKFSNITDLSKYFECSVSSLMYYQRSGQFIPVEVFQKAVGICKFDDKKVNSCVLEVKKRLCGKPIKIRLPIGVSPELAAVVGHSSGDGHISSLGRFVYVNNKQILINKVKSLVNHVFSNQVYFDERKRKDGSISLHYPSAVGEILTSFGAIKGNKTYKRWSIPNWIRNGDKEVKRAFLRAIFDDEGTVSKTRLAINMSKIASKKDSLIKLLDSFKRLLLDLEIKSSRTTLGHENRSKKGIKTINLAFVISEYYNMKKFSENIGFTHQGKSERLTLLLDSYIQPRNKTRKDILNLLKNKSLSTRNIRVSLNKTKSGIKYNLLILESEGRIKRTIVNKRKHLWNKNE